METNLVEMWLRRDPQRWLAGLLAGLVSGAVAMIVAMLLSAASGGDAWFPIKLAATPFLGAEATEVGLNAGPIIIGLLAHELLCGFFGFVFSHFVFANRLAPLLAMGAVWGAFSWVFLWNLYSQSFGTIFSARISSGPAFLFCMAYGLGLAIVAPIHRLLAVKCSEGGCCCGETVA